MDAEYPWILLHVKNCHQFRLLFPLSFIGQFVYPVGGEGIGYREFKGNCYFSPRLVSLWTCDYYLRLQRHNLDKSWFTIKIKTINEHPILNLYA